VGSRLEIVDADLARAVRAATEESQRRTADSTLRRVCAEFDPPLTIPDGDALDALVEELDAMGEERDQWRRARAAMAAQFLRHGEYEESLYEAVHAHPFMPDAIAEARATLLH
jgi:hypothetical protein